MPRKKIKRAESQVKDVADCWARERPDLNPDDYLHLIYAIRLGRMLDKLDDERNRSYDGLSSSEMRVIFALRRAGPPFTRRPTDLFKAVLVTSGAITKQVGRLIEGGYVERLPDPANNGGFLVRLTEAGVRRADDGLNALVDQSLDDYATGSLTREERHMFRILCEKFLLGLESKYFSE
jgi:DNA-binding MarR family transcriptional regulator